MLRFKHEMIREYRNALNMGQRHAAELAGVTQQQWSKWEYGTQTPSVDSLCKIMNALMMPLDSLLYIFSDEPETIEDREQITL